MAGGTVYSALYYPHTGTQDEDLLKTALLLWDRLEYISPFEDFRISSDSRDVAEAFELIGHPHVPSDAEKAEAHTEITTLVSGAVPEYLAFEPSNPNLRYLIYPQKFLPETWDVLRQSRLAETYRVGEFDDYVLGKWLGLTMMSVLARVCAGGEKRTITDEADCYAALTRYVTAAHAGQYASVGSEYERIATVALRTFDVSEIEFHDILELRKREVSGKDTLLRDLRHKYLHAIDELVGKLGKATHPGDREELQRVFESTLAGDLEELKRALRLTAKRALLSKEVAVAVLVSAGALVEPITSSLISTGALVKTLVDYRAARRAVLKEHAMSWLYLSKGRVQVV
jgi:hypothetical protein